tara:strand:+ start:473 stop:1360 length:888 start_codon:yes stop_codon:yes gene_type:complete
MKWVPEIESKDIILAIHGYNDYSNAFDIPGKFLLNHGIKTISFDLRGFGKNKDRGEWFVLQYHLDDVLLNLKRIKDKNPNRRIFLLGESMGGAIVISLAEKYNDLPIDGLILVAPAIWDFTESNFWKSITLKFFSTILPNVKVSGKGIIKVTASDNNEMLKRLSKDIHFIDKPSLKSLYGITNLMNDAFKNALSYLHNPSYKTLIMVPIRDEIVPRKPLIKIFKNSGIKKNISKMIDLGVYENSYHMILRDLEGSKIINDIRLWIENKNSIKQNNVFKDSLRKLNNNPYFHRLDK